MHHYMSAIHCPTNCLPFRVPAHVNVSLQVLGTDVGGTPEIVVENVTGLLHPVGSKGIPILAQQLSFLLQEPTARREMGQEGRRRVKDKFLAQQMFGQLGYLLGDIIRGREKEERR